MNRSVIACLILFCGLTLLFAPARHADFITLDDPLYALDPHVQEGLTAQGVRWAFTTTTLANWHPLTWLSYMLDIEMFGAGEQAAGGMHFVNVLLHSINGVLLYLLLNGMTHRPALAFMVTSLWAVHPLRVESVAWVSERKDLLCGLFFLLTLMAYIRFARRNPWPAYAMALLLYVLGLMSKPMIVTLPFLLLLLDLWPLARAQPWRRLLLEKLPFLAIAIAASVVTYWAQHRGGAMPGDDYPLALRLQNALWAYGQYLQLTLWPSALAVIYPYHGAIPGTRLSLAGVVAGAVLLALCTIVGVLLWRRERAVLIGWLWFVGTLVPVIGLVQVGRQSMADRYTYIPHIGLFIAVLWCVSVIAQRLRLDRPALAAGVTAILLIALAARTSVQLSYWMDGETLYRRTLAVTDHNYFAHSCLGLTLAERGQIEPAMEQFQHVIALKPDEANPYYEIGRLMAQQGRYQDARAWYEQALQRQPDYAEAHLNLALAMSLDGQQELALDHFRHGLRIKPDASMPRFTYARQLLAAGHVEEALTQFERVLRDEPRRAEVRREYAKALLLASRRDEAIAQLGEARKIAREQGGEQHLQQIEMMLRDAAAGGENPPLPIPASNPENQRD